MPNTQNSRHANSCDALTGHTSYAWKCFTPLLLRLLHLWYHRSSIVGRPSPPTMLYQRNLSEEPHVKGGIQRVSGLSLTLQMAGGAYFAPPLEEKFRFGTDKACNTLSEAQNGYSIFVVSRTKN